MERKLSFPPPFLVFNSETVVIYPKLQESLESGVKLKSRLSKIENSLNINSKFCICKNYNGKTFLRWEVFHQDLTIDSMDTTSVLQGEYVPDFCEKCGKAVEKKQIILVGCDASTKENYPEQAHSNLFVFI